MAVEWDKLAREPAAPTQVWQSPSQLHKRASIQQLRALYDKKELKYVWNKDKRNTEGFHGTLWHTQNKK